MKNKKYIEEIKKEYYKKKEINIEDGGFWKQTQWDSVLDADSVWKFIQQTISKVQQDTKDKLTLKGKPKNPANQYGMGYKDGYNQAIKDLEELKK